MDFAQIIQTVAIYALPVLFAITVHEAAHGYAARHFGDNTAYMLGRITLNPVKHIDPLGTILPCRCCCCLPPAGAFLFGYAKPVPVNFGRLRNPKRDMVWVALAGPASNLVRRWVGGAVLPAARHGRGRAFFLKWPRPASPSTWCCLRFNMFPLPPLDGGRILVGLLPMGPGRTVSRIEPFGFFIVLAWCSPACWAITGCARSWR
jgi:Zn-dependent protease